jgi:hypothetical protein
MMVEGQEDIPPWEDISKTKQKIFEYKYRV